jgi:hypothetical protein
MIKDSQGRPRFYGMYRGVVFDSADPDNAGRLRVKVPQLFADTVIGWVWPQSQSGVELAPPAIGQGVWIQFEDGDASFPVWTGTFGKNIGASKNIRVEPVADGSFDSSLLKVNEEKDGSKTIDLIGSLSAISRFIDGGSA